MNEQMEETTRQKLLGNLLKMKEQQINLMVTGATGVGKSSTINALFGEEVAKVGTSVNPETRLVYAQNINKEEAMWKDNDDLQDYRAGVLEKFVESVTKGIAIGGTIGQARKFSRIRFSWKSNRYSRWSNSWSRSKYN